MPWGRELALGGGAGLAAGLSLGALLWRRNANGVGDPTNEETSDAVDKPEGEDTSCKVRRTDNTVPPRPVHYALRPHVDPRIDPAMFVRYDPPPERKTGAVIIVIPGGNYDECDVYSEEGQPVAQWLIECGVTAVVLEHRCASRGHYWPAQFEDFADCARAVRAQAEDWGCDAKRVGVLGFSAGGHLASYAAARAEPELRPKLQVLVYPGIDTTSPHDAAAFDPWYASLGQPPAEASTHLLVDAESPPAFIVGLTMDRITPIEENSDVYAKALGDFGVPVEYIRHAADHGVGLQPWWTGPCEEWLRQYGWAAAAGVSEERQ